MASTENGSYTIDGIFEATLKGKEHRNEYYEKNAKSHDQVITNLFSLIHCKCNIKI